MASAGAAGSGTWKGENREHVCTGKGAQYAGENCHVRMRYEAENIPTPYVPEEVEVPGIRFNILPDLYDSE